jgi:hypothetical protein
MRADFCSGFAFVESRFYFHSQLFYSPRTPPLRVYNEALQRRPRCQPTARDAGHLPKLIQFLNRPLATSALAVFFLKRGEAEDAERGADRWLVDVAVVETI